MTLFQSRNTITAARHALPPEPRPRWAVIGEEADATEEMGEHLDPTGEVELHVTAFYTIEEREFNHPNPYIDTRADAAVVSGFLVVEDEKARWLPCTAAPWDVVEQIEARLTEALA